MSSLHLVPKKKCCQCSLYPVNSYNNNNVVIVHIFMADELVCMFISLASSLFSSMSFHYFTLRSKEPNRKVKEFLLVSKSRLACPWIWQTAEEDDTPLIFFVIENCILSVNLVQMLVHCRCEFIACMLYLIMMKFWDHKWIKYNDALIYLGANVVYIYLY